MATRKAEWFVRRASDNRILCTDGLWRYNAGCVDSIKFYSSSGRALRYGLKAYDGCWEGSDGTAYAVYHGDSVNCCGQIKREGRETYV